MANHLGLAEGWIELRPGLSIDQPDEKITTVAPAGSHGPFCGGSMYIIPMTRETSVLVCRKCFYRERINAVDPTVEDLQLELFRNGQK